MIKYKEHELKFYNPRRSNPDFIPELSLVMEKDGQIIGHVMFSKAELNIHYHCEPKDSEVPYFLAQELVLPGQLG